MPNWTNNDVRLALKRNPHLKAVGAGEDSAPEPAARPRSLAKAKAKDQDTGRFLVRICSIRSRLADPDGLVGKYHIDFLRYIGCIADDTAAVLDYEITQRKCQKGEEEHTQIEVYRLNTSPSNVVSEDE
jgi:hypothetical protein